jgi:hypothetical protein
LRHLYLIFVIKYENKSTRLKRNKSTTIFETIESVPLSNDIEVLISENDCTEEKYQSSHESEEAIDNALAINKIFISFVFIIIYKL